MSETNDTKIWTTHVERDEQTGELVLLFPPDMMKQAGWEEGDTLAWVVSEDGKSCYIRKLQSPEG